MKDLKFKWLVGLVVMIVACCLFGCAWAGEYTNVMEAYELAKDIWCKAHKPLVTSASSTDYYDFFTYELAYKLHEDNVDLHKLRQELETTEITDDKLLKGYHIMPRALYVGDKFGKHIYSEHIIQNRYHRHIFLNEEEIDKLSEGYDIFGEE